ncbi:MAG: hypothetical protein IPM94_14025 [bacterium]|nr:hypothetical protein [bacterium]
MRRFGFDAAILFSDILVPLEPMGAPFSFDDHGPRMHHTVRAAADVDALHVVDSREHTGYVAEAVRMIKRELGDRTPDRLRRRAVHAGGLHDRGRRLQDYRHLKAMLYSDPALLSRLLDKLADQITDYLLMQVEAGVDAVRSSTPGAASCTRRTTSASSCPGCGGSGRA